MSNINMWEIEEGAVWMKPAAAPWRALYARLL